MIAALVVLAAYLIGSLSFAVIVSRGFGLPDPHDYGSGNPGATNVLRSGNKQAALLTLVGDLVKGYVAVALALWATAQWALPAWTVPASAIAVFVGHLYPVFFHFRGGKGVSTAAGIVFALQWPLGLVLLIVWLTLALGFKISSLAALTAAVLMPLGMYYRTGASMATYACVVIALLIFWRHRKNIAALVRGEERVIGKKS
ncbi:MAG: glycerol-3-phosphate 1-O-acyltransferase PlsY [Proteobacteria bacterium]|nr:glycerol-3-phosphate 1-O-acyltransferase PlsY [Pseudomonadota bacterium]